jgi:hypothetical protein
VRLAGVAICLLLAGVVVQGQSPPANIDSGASAGGPTNSGPTILVAQRRRPAFSFANSGNMAGAANSPFTFTALASAGLPVTGVGTAGRLTKWMGFNSTSASAGDSTIFEDKFGKIGIGTEVPSSRLTVAGVIETTAGIKYPDGTIQITAFDPNQVVRSLNGLRGDLSLIGGANITVTPVGLDKLSIAAPNVLTTVAHDTTLSGQGTAASPLRISSGGVDTEHIAGNAVTAAKIAAFNVVKTLNGLTDHLTLAAGPNITITANGDTLTIGSPGQDPALSAFQARLAFSLPEFSFTGEIVIPANKRLVIEYITFELGNDEDAVISVDLITHLGNEPEVKHRIFPRRYGDHALFASDRQVRIYADGSVTIKVLGGISDAGAGSVTISGHLVNLP